MSKLDSSKFYRPLIAALVLFAGAPVFAAGPITNITMGGFINSNPSFRAGDPINTSSNSIIIFTFGASNTVPDGGETVTLQLIDADDNVVENGMSPTSFETQPNNPGSSINGGNLSLPITFFHAGDVRLRAIAAGETQDSASFSVIPGTATKLLVLADGIEHVPGTNPDLTTGLTGTLTPQEINQTFPVTVILTDDAFNRVSRNDVVSFAAVDLVTTPPDGPLSGGQADFSVTVTGARITRTLTVTNVSFPSDVSAGTLEITTEGPASKEVFPFPSPFNPMTGDITFQFRLADPKDAEIIVTNLFGQEVWKKTVSAGAGFTDVTWNGRNDRGEVVAAGVYYVLLKVGGSFESQKRFGVVK